MSEPGDLDPSNPPAAPAATVLDLRQNLAAWLRRVQEGASVTVTHHGRPIARIVPVADPRAEAKARLAALRKTAVVGDVEAPVEESWDALR